LPKKQDTNTYAVLTNLGEKMSDDEVDELLKAVDTSSGEINYVGMQTSRHSPQVYRMN
jgi:Ca2+-binding EF-hand superfamily protein